MEHYQLLLRIIVTILKCKNFKDWSYVFVNCSIIGVDLFFLLKQNVIIWFCQLQTRVFRITSMKYFKSGFVLISKLIA